MTSISDFIVKHRDSALVAAVITGVLSTIISIGTAVFSYETSIMVQKHQIKVDALNKFDESGASVVTAAGEFISAINDAKNLDAPKKQIRDLAAKRILDASLLLKVFPGDHDITEYEDAIGRFDEIAQRTNGPTEMKDWVEALDEVIVKQSDLVRKLLGKA
jgi:hypothetical protein